MSIDLFNNKYLVFGHGLRISDESTSHFILESNYRVVTLHIPGREIRENLVKIILNQINNKIETINDLFSIRCPIGRNETRITLENNFIQDYIKWIYKNKPEKINEEILDVFLEDSDITDEDSLNDFLKIQDYQDAKKRLGFEIRTYRPGDKTPRLLLDFKLQKNLSLIPGGIYNPETFKDFDFVSKSEAISIRNLSGDSDADSIKSLVNFDLRKVYLFDNKDVTPETNDKSFFKTIKPLIPSGLLVVLSCGKIDGKYTQLQRRDSIIRQRETEYRKYYIQYEKL